MKASLKFKFAVIAVATTAFALSTPAHAQFNNSGNQILGAAIGGVAGAALGDGIAGRGQSTEFGIAGGILGGIAGAAIAGNGNSNRSGYSQGGYSQGGYSQGGYYQQPTYYQQPVTYYQQPVYSSPVYYGGSSYGYGSPYYGGGRTNLNINLGSVSYTHLRAHETEADLV